MKKEQYVVFMLRSDGIMFWTGHRWDMRPYNAKCYAVRGMAEKAMERANKTAPKEVEIVEATVIVDVP